MQAQGGSMTQKRKITVGVSITIILSIAIIVTTVLATVLPRLNSFTSSNKTAITISELWDGSSFNSANVKALLETLSGTSGGTIDTISSNIDSNSGAITAAQIRNYTTNKSSGESVIVTFGGFEWIVVYLSKAQNNADDPSDDVAGDVIATLWLSGEATLDTSTFGNSSSYRGVNDPNSGVPTNMYGTSYIRAKLNNGGRYIDIISNSSNPTSISMTYTAVSNYKFEDFVQDGVLTQYMVTPANISWQENGQSAQETLQFDYNMSNENWTNIKMGATADSNFDGSGAYNYAGKTFGDYGNDTWKDDYLWLPSMTETGYNDTYSGMWNLSGAERSNGTANSWFRSATYYSSYNAYLLFSSGVIYSSTTVNFSRAVRPALHLNLTSVYDALPTSTITVNYNSSQGSATGSGEYDNGSTATLTATPATGYHFVNWTNSSGAVLSTSATYSHPVTTDETITANFAPNTYSVTLDQQSGSGGTTSITTTYNSAMPSATAPTRTGYTFQGYFTGTNGSGTQYYTNTMASARNWTETNITTLYAYWTINQYTISTAVTPNGVGQVTGGGTYNYNTSITLTATPTNSTYVFDYWDKNGTRLTGVNETSNTLNITVTDNATYTAHFRLVTYNVTINVNDSTLGQVLYNNQLNTSISSTEVINTTLSNIFAIPNEKVSFIEWQITTPSGTTVQTSNPLTTQITANTTITAVFGSYADLNGVCAIDINLLNAETNLAVVGTVSMNGYTTQNGLTSVHLSAVASKGYKFEYWTVDGEILTYDGTNPYTAVCDIPLKLVQGKIVVANFSAISNNNVNDDVNN